MKLFFTNESGKLVVVDSRRELAAVGFDDEELEEILMLRHRRENIYASAPKSLSQVNLDFFCEHVKKTEAIGVIDLGDCYPEDDTVEIPLADSVNLVEDETETKIETVSIKEFNPDDFKTIEAELEPHSHGNVEVNSHGNVVVDQFDANSFDTLRETFSNNESNNDYSSSSSSSSDYSSSSSYDSGSSSSSD